jgi:hypothetical protein
VSVKSGPSQETKQVETTGFYQRIERATKNPRIRKFVELAKIITPEEFIWYYGKDWNELKVEYCPTLTRTNELDDFNTSPFFERAKIFHSIKKSRERF